MNRSTEPRLIAGVLRNLLSSFLAVTVLAVAAVALVAAPAGATNRNPDHTPGWSQWCNYVKTTNDDPIVYPDQAGRAERHDFFGGTTANASSTYASLFAGGTTCLTDADHSAYWQPQLITADGKKITAKIMFMYYWAPVGVDVTTVKPMPSGLKMIASRHYYTCTGKGVNAPHKVAPLDCSPYAGSTLTAYITFPACWDATHLDSNDHASHMAYPSATTGCPSSHPIALPGLRVQVIWPIANGVGATLTTGAATGLPAEFFEAWDPAAMAQLTDDCMNSGVFCGAVVNATNEPPIVRDAEIIPTSIHETNTLTAIAINPHDPDGQAVTVNYEWRVNGTKAGGNSNTLAPSAFKVGDAITVTITPVDSEGLAGLPVTSPAETVAYDILAPTSAPPGGTLTGVTGGGFGAQEQVSLHLNSESGQTVGTVTTDGLGAFPATSVRLPSSISAGTHTLYGVGANSGIVGTGPYKVTGAGSLSPSALTAGDQTTLTAQGFLPGDTVSISFPGNASQTVTAGASGSASAALTAPSEPGPHGTITVASADVSYNVAYDVLPDLALPATSEPGVPTEFGLSGYGQNESVRAIVDGTDSGQTFTTDGSGAAGDNVVVRGTFGQHYVRMTGGSSGISKMVKISLPSYVSVSPKSGRVGSTVTVSSRFGWVPGEQVVLRFGGAAVATLTADAQGTVQTEFTIPSHSPGDVSLKLTDSTLGAAPETTFSVGSTNRPPSITSVSIDGGGFTNSTFTADPHGVSDPDGDPVTLHYAWTLNGQADGTDAPTYGPASLVAGDVIGVSVTPVDSHDASGATVPASALAAKWEIKATQGQPGGSIPGVDMFNFGPGETVDIHLDSPTGPIVKTLGVNSSGAAFNFPVPLPWPLAGGSHALYGVGQTSQTVGQGPITVVPAATLNPGQLAAGETTKVTGTGFVPGEMVSAAFPGAPEVSKTADATGSVLISVKSPAVAWPGGNLSVSAPSGSVTLPFKTLSTITFPVTRSAPGQTVPVTLTGYAPGETVEVTIQGSSAVTQTFVADSNGSVDDQVLMATTFGTHRITFVGVTSGISRQGKVVLPPVMTVSPSAAHVGDLLTISSALGWVPGETLYLYWNGTVVATLTADATGSVSTTFIVPAHKPGKVGMKLLDTVLGRYALASVTIS